MATGRTPSTMKSSAAAPPSTEKIGDPSAAPARITARPGQALRPSSTSGRMATAVPASAPSAATARPPQPGDARQTRRAATAPNPSGSTSCAIQALTPPAISVPNSYSPTTRAMAARHSTADTAAPTAAAKTSAARRTGPSGRNVPVASASSFPSRAASAAPRKAIQSVRC